MSKNVNVEAIWVLSALDKLMSDNKNDPAFFCKLFEKKQLIINALKERKIDGKKYKAIVGKALKDQNQVVKQCAMSDTLKLKDPKNQAVVNEWFAELINATGSDYENQEKLYQKYQSSIKPKQQQTKPVQPIKSNEIKIQPKKEQPPPPPPKAPSPPKNTQTSTIAGVNLDQIVSFKVIDNLIQKYEEKKQFYQVFLQKKRQLLDQVNNKSLTAQKYKSIVSACQSKTKNEDLQSDMRFELDGINDFHNGNTQEWFKELVQQTKDSLKEQEQHLSDLLKGKSSVKKQSKLISAEVEIQRSKLKQSGPINFNEIVSFKAIEQHLQNQQNNKVNYKILFQKKKNLLDLHKKGGLTAQKYKDMLVKAKGSVKNTELKESIEMELQQINDLHDGNIQKWYKDVIESAQLFLQDQQEKLANLQKGSPIKKKQDQFMLPIEEKPVNSNLQKKPSQNAGNSKASLGGSNQLCSLKAIDQYLTQNQKNPQLFCKYFERKLQIFQMMKSGELTPQRYKQLQEKTLKTTTNDKLKDLVEMDLADIDDMCDGDVDKWFQELVNDSGFNYEDQEKLYNKYKKNVKGTQQKKPESQVGDKQGSYLIKIVEKPVINDVICFTAIYKLFVYAVERVDLVYYKQLQLKRTKLVDLVTQNKLVCAKYRQINKAAAAKTQNAFLKNTIIEEEARLKNQFKGNEQSWFESLVGVLKSPPPEIKLPQNKQMKQINSSSTPKKVQYFLRQMAIHQCLYYFYKKIKVPTSENRYLVEYQKKRKQVVNCLQIIQQNPKFDVYNLAAQMFPPITNDIFYGDNLPALKKKAEFYIPLIAKEAAALKDYVSKIKKSTNMQNIQTAKKQIAKCEQNMVYLKGWPSGGLVTFPTITEQKLQKYNLDLNTKLDKNDMQIFITSVSGLSSQSLMSIFLVNTDKQRYSNMVNNGPLNVRFVAKLSEKQMFQVCKGDKKHLLIKFFKKGFFGGLSLISQGQIQTMFSRSNVIEEVARIGNIEVKYVLKVNKPMRPLVTQIVHYEVVQHPKYKHDKYVEQELIKKYIMYSSPTPSEMIHVNE